MSCRVPPSCLGLTKIVRHRAVACLCLCRAFTDTALTLSIALLTSALDLISFSGILFSIYPPLFVALILYSTTGTAVSLIVGKVRTHTSTRAPCSWIYPGGGQLHQQTLALYKLPVIWRAWVSASATPKMLYLSSFGTSWCWRHGMKCGRATLMLH